MLSESAYGRAWHAARQAVLGPDLADGFYTSPPHPSTPP